MINWEILSTPENWVTVTAMLAIAFLLVALINPYGEL